MRFILVWAILGVGACGSAVKETARVAPVRSVRTAEAQGEVSLQVAKQAQGKALLVAPGDTLRSGDMLALVVQVTRPAYLYVVQAQAKGAPEQLYPASEDRLVLPGEVVRLPSLDGWFRLDDQAGEDRFYVVAAREPMGQGSLAGRLGISLRGQVRGDAPPPPPPPPPPTEKNVGNRPVRASRDTTLRQSMDPGGVAVLEFHFRHE